MISKIPFDEWIFQLVSLLYAATPTLKPEPFAYVIGGKNRPIITFTAFCKNFLSALFRSPQHLALRKSWIVIAAIAFLLMIPAAARVGNTGTAFTPGEDVPVGDKLPANCFPVNKCQPCFPCQVIGGQPHCCDG